MGLAEITQKHPLSKLLISVGTFIGLFLSWTGITMAADGGPAGIALDPISALPGLGQAGIAGSIVYVILAQLQKAQERFDAREVLIYTREKDEKDELRTTHLEIVQGLRSEIVNWSARYDKLHSEFLAKLQTQPQPLTQSHPSPLTKRRSS